MNGSHRFRRIITHIFISNVMTVRNFLLLSLFLFSFVSPCFGQSKAIHFSISGIALGQEISSYEIQSRFSNYDVEVADYGSSLTLLFKSYSGYCFFDDIPMPINRMKFFMENGRLRGIELRSCPLDVRDMENKYDESVFNYIRFQYGIHDKGPNQYPDLMGGSINVLAYEWLGANGVTLSLWKEYEGSLTYLYLKCSGAVRSQERVSEVLGKLNSSTL